MALAADRNTLSRVGRDLDLPAATNIEFFTGAICCISATGYATKGAVATTLKSVGRVKEYVKNTGADGAARVKVERGEWYRFKNSASTDAITLADYGANCYIVDDETVAKTDGSATRSVAGKVRDVDSLGVWIEFP